jgi:hypothetical protein
MDERLTLTEDRVSALLAQQRNISSYSHAPPPQSLLPLSSTLSSSISAVPPSFSMGNMMSSNMSSQPSSMIPNITNSNVPNGYPTSSSSTSMFLPNPPMNQNIPSNNNTIGNSNNTINNSTMMNRNLNNTAFVVKPAANPIGFVEITLPTPQTFGAVNNNNSNNNNTNDINNNNLRRSDNTDNNEDHDQITSIDLL